MTTTTNRTRPTPATATALDRISYEWLATQFPDLVTAIEQDMARGATPAAIKFLVSRHVGPDRDGLALRCEQAARHMSTMQVEGACRWTITEPYAPRALPPPCATSRTRCTCGRYDVILDVAEAAFLAGEVAQLRQRAEQAEAALAAVPVAALRMIHRAPHSDGLVTPALVDAYLAAQSWARGRGSSMDNDVDMTTEAQP